MLQREKNPAKAIANAAIVVLNPLNWFRAARTAVVAVALAIRALVIAIVKGFVYAVKATGRAIIATPAAIVAALRAIPGAIRAIPGVIRATPAAIVSAVRAIPGAVRAIPGAVRATPAIVRELFNALLVKVGLRAAPVAPKSIVAQAKDIVANNPVTTSVATVSVLGLGAFAAAVATGRIDLRTVANTASTKASSLVNAAKVRFTQ